MGKDERTKKIKKLNGESEASELLLVVEFTGNDNTYYYTIEQANTELNLAYALTAHKAQGSEYDHVLIIIDKPIKNFINRNLIYTAASRGKKSVNIMIYSELIQSNFKDKPLIRKTNLVKMLEESVEYE